MPDKAEGYVVKPAGEDDEVGNFLAENEMLVPVLDTARAAALKAGMPMAMFDTFIREYAQNGLNPDELVPPDEREKIEAKKELDALVSMYGTEARATAVMDYVDAWGRDLVKKEVLSADDLGAFREAFGAADYTRVGYKIASYLQGQPPMPMTASDVGKGSLSLAEAEAQMADARKLPSGPDRDKAILAAEAAFKRVYAEDHSAVL